jgi:peptidase E
VPADAPTILASSGGLKGGRNTTFEFGPLTDYALELSGVSGRRPRLCYVGTAVGDAPHWTTAFYDAGRIRGLEMSHLALFTMPNVEDITSHLLDQDVIWVGGGSVAGLLAMWRLHGVDEAMRTAWRAGVVLTGVSAGSLCWHIGGTTDSFGPRLRAVTNGLALLPFSNGVHYDTEEQRRPLFQQLVADGTLPAGYATDNGVGLHYQGTEFVEALSETDDKAAYFVERAADGTAAETRIGPRRL